MIKQHHYTSRIIWTGNKGTGTSKYDEYERSHTIQASGKQIIEASSDAPFRGDVTKYNPEDFLLSAVSTCHMLWYLHLCADAGIIVVEYEDNPTAVMNQLSHGGGHFESITLNPSAVITDASKAELALSLHHKANEKCFIANSLNFKVEHRPTINTK